MPATPRIRVVVDADACVPAPLLDALGIVCAPPAPEYVLDRISVPELVAGVGVVEATAIAAACAEVAEPGEAVIYIRADDGHASPADAVALAQAAVQGRGARFASVGTGGALMGAGWAAVRAAERIAAGGTIEDAVAAAEHAAHRARVIAMLEHPEMTGHLPGGRDRAPGRMIVRLEGEAMPLLGLVPRREAALAALRDRFGDFATAPADGGRLRIAVHHAGAAAGAEALATWARRRFDDAEITIAPLTRHAARRLGPGMIGVAWLWDVDPRGAE